MTNCPVWSSLFDATEHWDLEDFYTDILVHFNF